MIVTAHLNYLFNHHSNSCSIYLFNVPYLTGITVNTLRFKLVQIIERRYNLLVQDNAMNLYSRVSNKLVGWNKHAGGIKLPIFEIF